MIMNAKEARAQAKKYAQNRAKKAEDILREETEKQIKRTAVSGKTSANFAPKELFYENIESFMIEEDTLNKIFEETIIPELKTLGYQVSDMYIGGKIPYWVVSWEAEI